MKATIARTAAVGCGIWFASVLGHDVVVAVGTLHELIYYMPR
jgi:hypothetical protein